MKINICYFVEAESIPADVKREKPSKGFNKAWKTQIFDKIIPIIEQMFPSEAIKINQTSLISFSTKDGKTVGSIRENSVLLDNFVTLFSFDIFWEKLPDGNKVHPTDEVDPDSLYFWIENFPNKQDLIAKRGRSDDVVQLFLERKKRSDKKYRFALKIDEFGESLKFTIQSDESEKVLEKYIGDIVGEWNRNEPNHLIHNYYLREHKRGRVSFLFNWGSATEEALDFLLEKLNESSMKIKKINITSDSI